MSDFVGGELMGDLIDRQEAIDSITNLTFNFTIGGRRGFQNYKEEFEKIFVTIRDKYIEALKALLPVEPETMWIPVTERLPGKHRSAIVTDFGHVTLAYTNNSDEWTDYDGNRLKNVTAWMPLPKPYERIEE